MSSDAHGYYGATNEDAIKGGVNSSTPRGIVRMPGRDDADALQRAIAPTGCTVAETRTVGQRRIVRLIFDWRDDTTAAMHILKKLGCEIEFVLRK